MKDPRHHLLDMLLASQHTALDQLEVELEPYAKKQLVKHVEAMDLQLAVARKLVAAEELTYGKN